MTARSLKMTERTADAVESMKKRDYRLLLRQHQSHEDINGRSKQGNLLANIYC